MAIRVKKMDDDGARILTNPNAEVDGKTITEWSEQLLKKLINTPAGDVNGTNDPNGTVAAAINNRHSDMYFITAAPSGSVRTFNVHHDQDVFLAIVVRTDAEGPGIAPTIPDFVPPHTFAEEVQAVLDSVTFSGVSLSVDGKPVTNLQETRRRGRLRLRAVEVIVASGRSLGGSLAVSRAQAGTDEGMTLAAGAYVLVDYGTPPRLMYK